MTTKRNNETTKPRTVAKGGQRTNMSKKVVRLRDKESQSWATIARTLDIAPRTARRLYDEQKGEGAHHGLLPGKGGRQVTAPAPAKAAPVKKAPAKKAPAKAAAKPKASAKA